MTNNHSDRRRLDAIEVWMPFCKAVRVGSPKLEGTEGAGAFKAPEFARRKEPGASAPGLFRF